MNIDLTDKNAIVCGASRGIGKAICFALAELGASITGLARSEGALHDLSRALPTDKGQDHDYIIADLQKHNAMSRSVQEFLSKSHKTIHILVNNTGGPAPGSLSEAEEDDLAKAFSQHLLSSQTLLQAVLPGMQDAGFGRIINITSTSVKAPIDGLGISNTIRGAVSSWSKTLSRELGHFGITVNSVLPGNTRTERMEELIGVWAREKGKTEAEITAGIQAQIPMKRFAEPEEIGNAVAFLASPAASYISGVNLLVDGGKTNAF